MGNVVRSTRSVSRICRDIRPVCKEASQDQRPYVINVACSWLGERLEDGIITPVRLAWVCKLSQNIGWLSCRGEAMRGASGFQPGRCVRISSHPSRLRWLVALVLALCTGASACSVGAPTQQIASTVSPSAPSHSITYGVDINLHQRDVQSHPDTVFQLAAAADARAVRTGIGWSTLEPMSGTYNWAPLDTLVRQYIAPNHLTLLFSFGDTPGWDLPSGANGSGAYPPVDCLNGGGCQSVQTFAAALAQHLSTLLPDVYIIPRNEPQNTAKNWVNGSPQEYAQFLSMVYAGAHSTVLNAHVLNGGEEIWPADYIRIMGKTRPAQFNQALYTNPLFCRSIDILDLHVNHAGPVYARQIVDASEHALQQCNGGKQIPVWVTEVGISSMISTQTQPSYLALLGNVYVQGNVSQQKFMIDTLGALAKDPDVIGINWVYMVDSSGASSPDEQGLGLVDTQYALKPAYDTFKALASG